ncbi:pro-sigmaK processing inhibitor BofA family protein [Ectobacillus panaciterrae]|uniref:pro-sigmaK processing inhibitor BofA family protein n=1 Tax=Ectobacillus panaciterrae TaxID=363872 RepID=UPI00041B81E4|nr:pro-sigmaK processing inhibitor BofA family protein [Ectobacillus panaciterrae]
MNHFVVILVIAGLIILLLLVGAPLKPLRFLGKTSIKIMVGALLLFGLNIIGTQVDLHIPINLATASITGILGVPGLIALAVIQMYILPH